MLPRNRSWSEDYCGTQGGIRASTNRRRGNKVSPYHSVVDALSTLLFSDVRRSHSRGAQLLRGTWTSADVDPIVSPTGAPKRFRQSAELAGL